MKNDLTDEQLRQEVTLCLPLGAVLRLAERAPVARDLLVAGESIRLDEKQLPVIGAPLEGGVFAGVTLEGHQAVALVLLPGDFQGTWADAMDWADKQDGALPSRIDMLVLWKNLKSEFKDAAYWTGEQHADAAGWAWCQHFLNGDQYYGDKGSKLRARAVRRLPL